MASPVFERLAGGSRRSSGGSPTDQLEVGQHIRRQMRADGCDTSYEGREISVDFLRYEQTTISRHLTIFEDYIAAVIGGDLHQGEVLLRHQRLLDASVPPGV